jgi:Pathogenicity locus
VPRTEQEIIAELKQIPNVGPATARDLRKLGIATLDDLHGRDPDQLYDELCARDGVRYDPCVRDVFAAVVAIANGEPSRPWWAFTPLRKARDARTD